MTDRNQIIGESHASFSARKAEPGECDYIALSRLPPNQKQPLWNAIKEQNPAKAECMKEAQAIFGELGGELVMTRKQMRKYQK